MQENIPVPTPEITPQAVTEQPKQSNFLTILLSVLLIISVLISGFFAYQTQKLVKELTLLKVEPTSTTTFEPTIEPDATENSVVDPTVNWKIYDNINAGIFLRYPSEISEMLLTEAIISGPNVGKSNFVQTFANKSTIVQNSDSKFDGFSVYEIEGTSLNMSFDQYLNKELEAVKSSPRGLSNASVVKLKIGNQQFSYIDSEANIRRYFILSPGNQRIVVFSRMNGSSDFIKIFDQILSTFKFLD